ncbi:hypothetical protein [Mucilaginibacter sp. 44-25]|uniref:hypothetical protein n=1 Tax=Mucilaginibacter sp. 44-25 TaxID=1895794 RepID=UPI000969193F|nr:hypothetical protein [Mucilaginibacter sp. 44-25]OJW15104.1 MAG: hypothetical protein BGO48_13220 [Mucilaginibacter sp. 44-25]PLW88550.1 MAG: hypothetical protein C0154_16090 [Mucilaginibacter sp.]HEK19370.1 hypothetical protein [Bacteroidota bacterium]
MEFLVLLLAPVLQITLSALKITGKLKLKLGIVAALCFALGIVMCFASMKMVLDQLAERQYHCGMPAVGAFIVGLIITFITVPLIWVTSYTKYRVKNKSQHTNHLEHPVAL